MRTPNRLVSSTIIRKWTLEWVVVRRLVWTHLRPFESIVSFDDSDVLRSHSHWLLPDILGTWLVTDESLHISIINGYSCLGTSQYSTNQYRPRCTFTDSIAESTWTTTCRQHRWVHLQFRSALPIVSCRFASLRQWHLEKLGSGHIHLVTRTSAAHRSLPGSALFDSRLRSMPSPRPDSESPCRW